jgi:antitoxin PrlF
MIGRISYHRSMKATVSEKGQVTIPKKLRERLGIRTGDVLDFDERAGELVARKALIDDPIEAVRGIFKTGKTTDEIMLELRGEPDAIDPP